jgi:thymidylate synthase
MFIWSVATIMNNTCDTQYVSLLSTVYREGITLTTRNSKAISHIQVKPLIFDRTPLVTVRKTAWKTALKEMQWFMSGDTKCPDDLLPWWKGQLSPKGHYYGGYGEQYRSAPMSEHNSAKRCDQIAILIDGLRYHPNSLRHVLTAWNPGDMSKITDKNSNLKTPTTCHSTMIQFFVRDGLLHSTHYQRSADLLLGVPHNWLQHWALMLYLAHHAKLKIGSLQWVFGDAHIYHEPTHIQAVEEIISKYHDFDCHVSLKYVPWKDHCTANLRPFIADDFVMEGDIPAPLTAIRPRLIE